MALSCPTLSIIIPKLFFIEITYLSYSDGGFLKKVVQKSHKTIYKNFELLISQNIVCGVLFELTKSFNNNLAVLYVKTYGTVIPVFKNAFFVFCNSRDSYN